MTTWEMDTVNAVSRLWVEADLDDGVVLVDPDAVHDAMHTVLGRRLIALAHALGATPHLADIGLKSEPSAALFRTRFMAAWRPSTAAVELVGGERDGDVIKIQRVGEPLRIPIRTVDPYVAAAATSLRAPSLSTEHYELVGWREVERRWVYQVAP